MCLEHDSEGRTFIPVGAGARRAEETGLRPWEEGSEMGRSAGGRGPLGVLLASGECGFLTSDTSRNSEPYGSVDCLSK